jgi:hypothetical protein
VALQLCIDVLSLAQRPAQEAHAARMPGCSTITIVLCGVRKPLWGASITFDGSQKIAKIFAAWTRESWQEQQQENRTYGADRLIRTHYLRWCCCGIQETSLLGPHHKTHASNMLFSSPCLLPPT